MLELRAAAAGNESRAQLRALAAEFPGALRELDSLPSAELARRHEACARAAGGTAADEDDAAADEGDAAADEGDAAADEGDAWIEWMARYHELMRAALAVRRGEPVADVTIAPELLQAFVRPPGGRLNAAVFAALAEELGVPARALAATLFPARGGRR
jgi:hypothetical protein